MAMTERRGFCKDCARWVLVRRPGTNHLLHLVLTLVSCGLWLPIWILSSVQFGGWRCGVCGSTRVTSVR